MYFAVCSEMLFCVCAILTDTLVRIQLVAYRGKKKKQKRRATTIRRMTKKRPKI